MATTAVDRTQRVTELALTWPEQAQALTITTPETYTQAGEMLRGIKALRKEINDTFDPIISRAHEAHREACAQKKKAETPLAEAETILKRGLIAFDTEQERLRRIEELRLQELARQEEEARQLAEAAALEAQANATADLVEAYHIRQDAEAVLAQPIVAPVVVVQKATPKVAGLSYREVWRYRVTDARQIPREYLSVDDVKIGGVVRALKGATAIPGIEVYAEKVASAGR
jgi:hypothetical protein